MRTWNGYFAVIFYKKLVVCLSTNYGHPKNNSFLIFSFATGGVYNFNRDTLVNKLDDVNNMNAMRMKFLSFYIYQDENDKFLYRYSCLSILFYW